MKTALRWLWRLFSPFLATFVAVGATLALAKHSFVDEALSDASYRFPKWWRVTFWRAWYPEAFYYAWRTPDGGQGPARWMWRAPKHPNWVPSVDWWVFRG